MCSVMFKDNQNIFYVTKEINVSQDRTKEIKDCVSKYTKVEAIV